MAAEIHLRKQSDLGRYVPQVAILLLGALLLWHCRHGLCHSDEAFYLALVHRFWTGDRLLIDEWQIAQLYAPILLPAYSLFRALVPSGDGAYLVFRILYVLLSLVSPLLLLAQAARDRLPKAPATVAAALLLLYSRANINGPSYYNLCLHFLTLSVLLCYLPPRAPERTAAMAVNRVLQVLTGVSFALACICCPPLVLFLPAFLYLVHLREPDAMRFVVVSGLGCVALYLVPIFAKASVSEIFAAAQTVLSDPEHQQSWLDRALKVAYIGVRDVSVFVVPVLLFATIEEAHSFTHNEQGEPFHRAWAQLYPWIIVLILMQTVRVSKTSICFAIAVPAGLLLMPFVVHGFLARKGQLPLGVTLYLTGVALAISFFFGSNTGLDAMTGGFALGTIGGFLCWAEQLAQQRETSPWVRETWVQIAGAVVVATLLVALFIAHRFLGTYRDAPLQRLTVPIEEGPAAGLLTTQEHRDAYEAVLDALRVADEDDAEGGLLVSRLLPWAYLASGRRCSSHTAWSVFLSDNRLMPYYAEEGHSFPKMVLVVKPLVGGFETAPFNDHKGYVDFNFNEMEGPFYDWLMESGSVVVENDYLTLYKTK